MNYEDSSFAQGFDLKSLTAAQRNKNRVMKYKNPHEARRINSIQEKKDRQREEEKERQRLRETGQLISRKKLRDIRKQNLKVQKQQENAAKHFNNKKKKTKNKKGNG
mmetsp:Transcript_5880/g.8070  ORF Transcript_5880/g.8070 Transcript_5880/m.8070 type:complete len:107 (+) Transcript_5880:249-569(+)